MKKLFSVFITISYFIVLFAFFVLAIFEYFYWDTDIYGFAKDALHFKNTLYFSLLVLSIMSYEAKKTWLKLAWIITFIIMPLMIINLIEIKAISEFDNCIEDSHCPTGGYCNNLDRDKSSINCYSYKENE